MNICIFCSAYVLDSKYTQPAEEISELLAQAGHHLVWGGSDTGLMKVIADAFRKHGGKLYGVSIEAYKDVLHKNADELIIAKDLGTRKAAMLEKADAIIVLPGGIGTLDEFSEVLELRKQKHHLKPIILLNTDDFYSGLHIQLQKMESEHFITVPLDELLYVADKPVDVIEYLNSRNSN